MSELCEYNKDRHIELLKITNEALAFKLADLNKRKMARNTEMSLKWRRQAYYYKEKCKSLESMIKNNKQTGGGI